MSMKSSVNMSIVSQKSVEQKDDTEPTFLIYIKCMGAVNSNKVPFDIPAGLTVGDFKKYVFQRYPHTKISRIMFSGQIFRDDKKTLADCGVYKECTLQVLLQKRKDDDIAPNIDDLMPKLKRTYTEEAIQFGDVILIRLVCAKNLMACSKGTTNAYAVLTHSDQIQRGAVQKQTLNPKFNEIFGFYIENSLNSSDSLTITLYHHDFDSNSEKSIGSHSINISNLVRHREIDHFLKLDSGQGEILLSIHRAPLVSNELQQILKKLVSLKKPWTKQMLTQYNIKLGSFIGTEPWNMSNDDNNKNPILDNILKMITSNKLNFSNAANINRIASMLKSQKAIVTNDAPCPVLYLSDIELNEKSLFDYLQKIVPNGIKSFYFNYPYFRVAQIASELSSSSLDKNASAEEGTCVIQFKSTQAAVKALLTLKLYNVKCLCGFGPPLQPNDSGVIGSKDNRFISGFLQCKIPKIKKQNNDEEKMDDDINDLSSEKSIGEHFHDEDELEFPQYWVEVNDQTIVGYRNIHDLGPSFQLDLRECTIRKSGSWTFDLVDIETNGVYEFRSTNQPLLSIWKKIVTEINTTGLTKEKNYFEKNIQMRTKDKENYKLHKCYLSKTEISILQLYSPDGHKWFADRKMLNQYIRSCLSRQQLDQISTRFTVSDLKDLLPRELFEEFSEKSLKLLLESKNYYITCPGCNTALELLTSNDKKISQIPEVTKLLDRLRDEDGKKLTDKTKQHWLKNRIGCRKCKQDFCKTCWECPYHAGDTCESLRAKKSAPKCRFCSTLLSNENRISNPISKALSNVCNKKECVDKMKISSPNMLNCGHYSLGIKDEKKPTPCIFKNCKNRDSDIDPEVTVDSECCICYTDKLGEAPIIVLDCNHVFHYMCIKKILTDKWKTAFISFQFKECPVCKQDMKSKNIQEIIAPLDQLQMELKQAALKRLKYEQRESDKPLQKGGKWYGDEIGYAEHVYAFFLCYECKKPYFGGAKECKAQDDEEEVDKKELICNKCQNIESIDECKEHGPEYLAYKCRYCCTMGVFHCWGKVHFCRSCHQPGVWDKLSTYSTGKNKKNIQDYPQCEGIKLEIAKLLKHDDWNKWTTQQKEDELKKVRANPDQCPLGARHPPNGFEFGLGCTLCADEKTKLENEKARKKVEMENKKKLEKLMGPFMNKVKSGTKFIHKHPMDENGILHFFGSFGKSKTYQNPGKLGMVIVHTSEMMPDSEHCSAFIGRQCVRCVTKPSASCWFSVDFVDKYVKPSHYTLRHYISWDTECLRNWVIEGSINGEEWLVLRQHQNDQALNYKGQAYTWALHDYGCAFRRIRIKQTGPNNNNHYFLACSGFECYGTLYKDDTGDIEYNFQKAYQEQQKMKSLSLVRFWQMVETGQAGVYHFTFSEDFDDNGILYFLGTKGGQQSWKNPSITDEVSVCSSALVKDSVEISYFVGREALRLVTKPEDNAWMQVDFKDKLIQPSYYSLRHYISWDTECLRNWILQASNDGIRWVTVKKHEEDTSLNEKGATHTWPVQSRGAYRIWRIKQTGFNSNKHKYLACSGIEFYGQLFLTKFDPLAGLKPNIRTQAEQILRQLKFVKKCKLKENNDKNGVVYWIGTRGGTSNWVNPGVRKWIKCDASSVMRDSQPVSALCGRISVRLVTQPLENSWMSVDFKNLYISPTHYALRHYISWDTEALRNWLLEASFDGNTWHTLRQHKNDASLNHKGATHTWEIKAKGAKYRAFRIRQIGVNSNKHFYLSLSGFEIYGDVFQIGYPNSNNNSAKQKLNKNGEYESQFDASLTGQVPWDKDDDNNNGPGSIQKNNSIKKIEKQVSSPVQEESQDMALLREMARQEKQRLIHHLSAGNPYPFYYTKDFDENGILYFLGTDWRTAPWRNPAEAGVVTVTSSRLAKDSYPATAICGKQVVRCVCMAEKNNWFMIDFRNIYIKPTHYCLRHYDSWDTECLRNWYLEGTNDLKKFKIIREHKKDKSLFGKGSTHTWQLDTHGKRYRAFRIRQFGHNSNKHWYLACSGVEFYGEIYFRQK